MWRAVGGLGVLGRKPPFLYMDEDKHTDPGIPRAPMSYSLPSFHLSAPIFDDPLTRSPAIVHGHLPIGRETIIYCTSSFVTHLAASLLLPLFFIVFHICSMDPHFHHHLSHSLPAHVDTSIVFSIYLSSPLPPRDFMSNLREGVVCTIAFNIFCDLT